MSYGIRPEHDIVCGLGGCRADYRPYQNKPYKPKSECCNAELKLQKKKNGQLVCSKCMKLV